MILNRLYELAVRKQLLADTAFEMQPVPFVVLLDEGGKFLGNDERRGEIVTVKKSKKGETVKRMRDRGKEQLAPRAHGNTANQGFARFFVDTLPRVLPLATDEEDRAKFERSRTTFWEQIDTVADATNDPALRAVQAFGRTLKKDANVVAKIQAAVAEKNPASGDRVTFAYHPDGGKTILERSSVGDWYRDYFNRLTKGRQEAGHTGFCTLVGQVGPLPTSHPIKLSGVPGGLATGVSIVSFDKAAFKHYGLDGAENAAIGYEGADGYARGFQWLRGEKDHHFVIGGTLFLFWTRQDASTDFVMALGAAYAAKRLKVEEKDAKAKAANTNAARKWMCENFYDIRAFGAVMTTGVNCGQVRGPVQCTFARSVDPIVPLEYSITRKSVTTEEEAKKQAEKDGSITGTMGRKNTVPYGLYRCHGFVNPYLAEDTGFSDADLELLWTALKGAMWEIDRSASRGLMATRGLYVFEHESRLGNAPPTSCSIASSCRRWAPTRRPESSRTTMFR
jgi:CRISPR-associated protein Cas7/Csd2 subtype I-C